MTHRQWSRISDEDREEMVRMYRDGKTIREIAEWLGRPTGSIHYALRHYREPVEMRPAHGNRWKTQ